MLVEDKVTEEEEVEEEERRRRKKKKKKEEEEGEDEDVVLTGRTPDRKLCVQLKRQTLRHPLGCGRYPEYLGAEGP